MNTLSQLSQYARQALQDFYPDGEIRSICRILYEDVFHLTNIDIHLKKNERLDESFINKFYGIVERLKTGEPLQYIIGSTEFRGLRLEVNRSTLIPRPETSELAAWASGALRAGMRVLDIGTGSGCLAIALAQACPGAVAEGIDISAEAVATAQRNAAGNDVKVEFSVRDILRHGEYAWGTYDLIVSNPPYVRECERAGMERNVLDYEPPQALFVPDDDPLVFYRAIGDFGQAHLKAGGMLFLEINEALGQETARLLERQGYVLVEVRQDMYGKERMVKATKITANHGQ